MEARKRLCPNKPMLSVAAWLLLHLMLIQYCHLSIGVNLRQVLQHYEMVDVRVWSKRRVFKRNANDLSYPFPADELLFRAFDKQFQIVLYNSTAILSSTFKAYEVNDRGKRQLHSVDPGEFYHGHLKGETRSMVSAHIDHEGAVTASIWTPTELYHLEPAWRHVSNASASSTVVYRTSDLINVQNKIGPRFCNALTVDQFGHHSIGKRETKRRPVAWNSKNRCSLKLVADYRFHKEVGGYRTATTIRYLISLIDRVNSIYTQTVWKDSTTEAGFDNLGFVIKSIVVHTGASQQYGHYNSDVVGWEVGSLLQRFSEAEGSGDFCLVHLFTAQPFSGGVLGLSYIASPKLGTPGGICSEAAFIRNKLVYFNTALSSVRSSYGGPVVTREADIVTAHELGHNWGSPHDPVSNECSPKSAAGGPYIMFTYSVSGYDQNNKVFSPCSKRSIKAVLMAKSHLCFVEEEHTFCGNQLVEPGEDCDVGLLEQGDDDPCCSSDCKFKHNAKCSPLNSPCCSNTCQFLVKGFLCGRHDPNSCKRNSYCDGLSGDCPVAPPADDGTPCMDDGECQDGECMSFCERRDIGMKPCICENQTQSCWRCCRPAGGNVCAPFIRKPNYRTPKVLADGTRCIHGYCVKGNCKREVQDLIEHIWDIIDKLDINAILKFMKNNMVSTVALSTLLVWIPASLLINSMDREKSLQRDQGVHWIYTENAMEADKYLAAEGQPTSVRC